MESVSEQQVLTVVQMNPRQQAIIYKSLAPSLITEKPRLWIQFVAHKEENVLQLRLPALVAERLQLLENIPTHSFTFCCFSLMNGISAWTLIVENGKESIQLGFRQIGQDADRQSLGEINPEFCLFLLDSLFA